MKVYLSTQSVDDWGQLTGTPRTTEYATVKDAIAAIPVAYRKWQIQDKEKNECCYTRIEDSDNIVYHESTKE